MAREVCMCEASCAWIGTSPLAWERVRPFRVRCTRPRNVLSVAKRRQISMSSANEKRKDDYKHFDDLLGDATKSEHNESTAQQGNPQRHSQENELRYIEFADLLGVEAESSIPADHKKEVTRAVPTKNEINPADYEAFDNLLRRSGGKGRKPVKGSKRYLTRPEELEEFQSRRRNPDAENEQNVGSMPSRIEEATSSPQGEPARLSKEETQQAYEFMMEEFGAGMHETYQEVDPGIKTDNAPPKLPQLRKPPMRPNETRTSENPNGSTIARATNEGAEQEGRETTDTNKAALLEPKPIRPSNPLEEPLVQEGTPISKTMGTATEEEVGDQRKVPVLQPGPRAVEGDVLQTSTSTEDRGVLIEDGRVRTQSEEHIVDDEHVSNDYELLPKPKRTDPPRPRAIDSGVEKTAGSLDSTRDVPAVRGTLVGGRTGSGTFQVRRNSARPLSRSRGARPDGQGHTRTSSFRSRRAVREASFSEDVKPQLLTSPKLLYNLISLSDSID